MKKIIVKKIAACALGALLTCGLGLAASGCEIETSLIPLSIKSIEKTSTDGLVDTYTIYYSDGTESTFEVTNGADGESGADGVDGKNGEDGKDGVDGKDITVEALYERYVTEYGEIDYADFLEMYMTLESEEYPAIHNCLQTTAKVYTAFTEPDSQNNNAPKRVSYTGASVIYKIEEEYTYFLTNYHVTYDEKATDGKISEEIHCYLYGSESAPKKSEDGLSYSYDDYAIACEYVGGAATYDLALLRARTADVKAVNPNVKAVTFAEDYYVGESAITVGNPGGEGISVTKGIVSVDADNITLSVDGTSRTYRSIRIDTPLYKGNSGGGLFNRKGELIGISNAGDLTKENINYAIPLQIVKSAAENMLSYAKDGLDETQGAYKIKLGITVTATNSKYTYDAQSGYGKITEDVLITAVEADSLAFSMGFADRDIITAIVIEDETYAINRYYEIGDYLLYLREGTTFSFLYKRNGENYETAEHTVERSQLNAVE